ncbi:MAG: DUF58 domain-containing protein, partial [Phycisphaerae bacterium]|nr:DUF58 domain-containing protein [Phycisphaerae bacterium]
RFIVEGFLAGLHGSPYHGFSVEFSEHRKYVPGDELRQIDWNVFAKTDRFYVKKYQAETTLDAYLLVDTSASMAYPPRQAGPPGSERMTKFDYAICLAAALGYLMVHQQDAVGLVCFDAEVRAMLPPRTRRTHLLAILGHLARLRPWGQTGLARALHTVADRVRKRSLMIVLSDFLDEPDAVVEALHHLRFRKHDVILFQVLDTDETQFPFTGLRRFEDTESSAFVTTDAEAVRAEYIEALRAFVEHYRDEAAEVRADFVQVDTGMTFDTALVQYLVDRQRRF